MKTTANLIQPNQQCSTPILIHQVSKNIIELTLAPSGDEILPVRSQELQTNAFIKNKLKKHLPSVHWAWSQLRIQHKTVKELNYKH